MSRKRTGARQLVKLTPRTGGACVKRCADDRAHELARDSSLRTLSVRTHSSIVRLAVRCPCDHEFAPQSDFQHDAKKAQVVIARAARVVSNRVDMHARD